MSIKRLVVSTVIAIIMIAAGALVWKMIPAAQKATESFAKFIPKDPTPTSPPILLRNNTRPFLGPIVSKEGEKLVIKNADGKDVTVLTTSSTTITGGKASNLLAGTKISGVGKVNNDGIITAQTIQINPQSPLNKR